MASTKKTKKAAEKDLTRELATLLQRGLLPDLQDRARDPGVEPALRRQHAREQAARRTADRYESWRERLVEQVAAAWVLSCVFLRTLEDRGLLAQRRLAGPGAKDSEQLFFELAPALSLRDYLLLAFQEVARLPGAEALLGPRHNLAFRLPLSAEAAQELLSFFRVEDAPGELRHGFAGSDTRFLGDLYQDLSASVRERYALLQTPRFVERFLLDLTLEPALEQFGLAEVRLLDPTCGSGHFLLGAFDRLCEHRSRRWPALDPKEHALAALGQVHGIDINPFAVAIARFRLTLAYLERAGIRRLAEAPRLPLSLVVADSLLHGAKGQTGRFSQVAQGEGRRAWNDSLYELEDADAARKVLGQGYHAVVGNPPYITCKDAVLREEYRKLYDSAAGKYALAAPFTELFFQLPVEDGYVGLINSNSFMKREFGKKLIEEVLPRYELTRVIDTAGAFIPGHGTPTVLLFGRNRRPLGDTVRAVLGKRGEPSAPDVPEEGQVWSSIERHFDELGYEDDYISVAEMPRATFDAHPWSLGGGGAAELKTLFEERGRPLSGMVENIGFASFIGLDDAFILPASTARTLCFDPSVVRPIVVGESVRDWGAEPHEVAIVPYDKDSHQPLPLSPASSWGRYLWHFRTTAGGVTSFGGRTRAEEGQDWWLWYRWQSERYAAKLRLTFAEVATHNHFVLDRGGKVFKQTAPIIKLPATATEEEHLALLGYLNSSCSGFYLRQVCQNKGIRGEGGGITAEAWEQFLQRNGASVSSIPVPDLTDLWRVAAVIDRLARSRARCSPAAVLRLPDDGTGDLKQRLADAAEGDTRRLARMVALQEELDWMVYESFGLLTVADLADLRRARGEALPGFPITIDDNPASVERQGLHPGHRPFEIALAARLLQSGEHTAWFTRNNYRSPSEVSATYAPVYLRLLEARVAIIDRNPRIALIERPEYKRRWTLRDPDKEAREAADQLLCDAAEEALRTGTTPATARALAGRILRDEKLAAVAAWRFGADSTEEAVQDLLRGEAVPFLAAHRYSDAGLENHALWEQTWALQRREDAGEKVAVPVPPRYDAKDYRATPYWRLRGKLDVPKERFVSYPGAERDDDRSPLLGWAGWDPLQRAMVLASLYHERKDHDSWPRERLVPLLAGLQELVPWLKQWHNEPSADHDGARLGDDFAGFVESEARALGVTPDDLRAFRPEKPRGRRAATPKTPRRRAKEDPDAPDEEDGAAS